MSFKFPYEHIIKIKEQEKETAYLAFGAALQQKERMIRELQDLQTQQSENLRKLEGSTLSISTIQQQTHYLNHMNEKIAEMEKHLISIEKEVWNKQQEFLEKQKDERTWHHLREKSHEAYIQEQRKAEQNMLDEMATVRYYHQRLSL